VQSRRHRPRGDDDSSVYWVIGGVAGLLILTVIVVLVSTLSQGRKATVDPVSPPQVTAVSTESLPPTAAADTKPEPEPTAASTVDPGPSVATSTPTQKRRTATLPEKMRRIPSGSRQIVIVTGARIGANTATLKVFNEEGGKWVEVMRTNAYLGKNGLVDGKKRVSGHLQTPTGIWSIGSFVFGLHSRAPAGTKMPYRPITKNSWWSAQRDSTYNKWVERSARVQGEHLADADPQYEYAFNTGYNSLPNERVLGRGTAIFIHCSEPPGNQLGKFTHGCIAISPKQMIRLFRILDPKRHPTCAIGTLRQGSSTSIWEY